MNHFEALEHSIKFATFELKYFEEKNDLSDTTNMVVCSLFRKIIELSTGVKVSATNGLKGPAELSYRGLIEAYLAYKYITHDREKEDNRAKAYKIGYHKLQIESAETNGKNPLFKFEIPFLEEVIDHHRKELEREDFRDLLKAYDKLHRQNKRGHLPKWYSVNNGPKSINQLASFIEERVNNETDKRVMSTLYGALSSGAHNLLALRDIKVNTKGEFYLNPIQSSFNPEIDDYNIQPTRALLTSSILNFTINFCPDYTEHLQDFVSDIERNLVVE